MAAVKVKYKEHEITIKSFRDLTNAEFQKSNLSKLPEHSMEPATYEGMYYFVHPDYDHTAFLVPGDVMILLDELAIENAKRAIRNALDLI